MTNEEFNAIKRQRKVRQFIRRLRNGNHKVDNKKKRMDKELSNERRIL